MSSLEDQAQSAENAGDLESALSMWIRLGSETRDAIFYCRAGMAAERLKRWREAEDALRRALKLDPMSVEAMECLGSLFLARTDGDPGEQLLEARNWFERALRVDRSARLLTFLGSTYSALGDKRAAREVLREAVSLDSTYEEAYFNIALLEKDQNPQEAQDLLEKAIELDPGYAKAHRGVAPRRSAAATFRCQTLDVGTADCP